MPQPVHNATLVHRIPDGPHNLILRVRSDEGPLRFVPGQFVNLGALGEDAPRETRAYSVASAPGAPEAEFALTLVDGGRVTPGLFRLQEGDRLAMETVPAGNFTLRDVPPDASLLMVATGTGMAPFMSMIRSGQTRGRQVIVVHGARNQSGLSFRDELKANPELTYLPCCTRDPDWKGVQGRVQQILVDLDLDPKSTHALLCGNPEMIADVRVLLEQRGFKKHRKRDPGNLHFEAYW